jgi:hypothetical protein
LSTEEAFEYTVLEYPFSFWQWGGDCAEIPDSTANLDAVIKHLLEICDISFFSDGDMLSYSSHYYQAGSEMGYYGYDIREWTDYLRALQTDRNPSAVFMPGSIPTSFTGVLPKLLFDWLQGPDADRIAYIYGASDTWTATAVPPSPLPDAEWFVLPGKDHGKARIANMSDDQRTRFIERLEAWLELDIE